MNEVNLKCIIDTGSSINLLKQNIFSFPILKNPINVQTINGTTKLSESILFGPSRLCPTKQKFYIHNFSENYDMLLGREYLKASKSQIDYENGTVTFGEYKFTFQNKEENSEEAYTEDCANPPLTEDRPFNFAIEDELKECNEFRLEHLNREEVEKLKKVLHEFRDIQYREGENLTFTSTIKHSIQTKHEDPLYKRPYKYPQAYDQEVNKQINEMIEQGIIKKSKSPYCSPIWIVPKKMDASGKQKFRLVIDYRNLNEITIDDKFPIPNMDEILDKLGKCQYFTTIDLAKGFHQIQMDPDSIAKTAFSTKHGHYEFTRMPFGLKNAPATFQRCMNNLLEDLIFKDCLVYLDDIIIYSTSLEEHISSISKVFSKLREANLKLQLDKCEFMKKETDFLGHVITTQGIKPNPNKIKAIVEFPIPKTPKEIKSFLGLCGFYRKFIPNFANIAKPMTTKLKKNATINIKDPTYVSAFEKFKVLITSDPILVYPNFEKPFSLTTDASNFAIGAVLSQEHKPICYASRTLNEHESNYSAIEKELLAIVWATKYFRSYLFGRKFQILSDHKPLVWLSNIKEPNMKLQRWKIRLNEYDYQIKYLPGKENNVADALSRIKIEENFLGEDAISTGATIHSAQEDSQYHIPITERPLNYFNRQIEFIKGDDNKVETNHYFHKLNIKISYKEMNNQYAKDMIKEYLCSKKSIVYFHNEIDFPIFQRAYLEIINPSNITKIMKTSLKLIDLQTFAEFKELILKTHKKLLHPGIEKTINWFKEKYYYPDYQKLIQNLINECEICNIAKTEHRDTKLTFEITPEVLNVRDKYVIDFYMVDKKQFLSCIDVYSKFTTLVEVQSRDWLEAKRALLKVFNEMGKPIEIKADKDSAFISVALQIWLQEEGIKINITTSKTGISDIERFHKTINEKLRIIGSDDNIENKITKFETILYTYNYKTKHKATNRTPADIFIYAGTPEYNSQENKVNQINNLNKNRSDFEVDTRFRQAPLVKSKTTNPFKKTGNIKKLDEKHYEETNRGRKVTHYRSKFKKKKIINKSKYVNSSPNDETS